MISLQSTVEVDHQIKKTFRGSGANISLSSLPCSPRVRSFAVLFPSQHHELLLSRRLLRTTSTPCRLTYRLHSTQPKISQVCAELSVDGHDSNYDYHELGPLIEDSSHVSAGKNGRPTEIRPIDGSQDSR
jgi:hypothetical protein